MKFDNAGKVEEVIWNARLADLPRSQNRTILQRMFNGEPPFDENEAEDNGIEINRNDLTGVNALAKARSQWNSAFLSSKNYFNVALDYGPAHKRDQWGMIITKEINKQLKCDPKMREQIRSTGANVMLHGIGPVNWPDRRTPVPNPIPISSLLIPSETEIDFENLPWFAVFREWTPAQLICLTDGPKRDPGWNMPLVRNQLRAVAEQVFKRPNATAFQYMPERVEELMKQDLGYWGSDAVPTVDVWDFYFREEQDGGWYRRVVLDWGIGINQINVNDTIPESKNTIDGKVNFLYSSGKRRYADDHSQIIHCQFGDTSCYAPFKYHSVRSLGWMIWGPCDLQNRMYCKFMENAFMNLMWWFRVSGEQVFNRIKRADFFHMGVIPDGVSMIPSAERFQPDPRMIELAFARNRQLMAENAASYTSDFSKGGGDQKEMTATETMARVNATNALVSGMLTLAYAYEAPKDREIARRYCIMGNPDKRVREFRKSCLKKGIPEEALCIDYWDIQVERIIGDGDRTLQMAVINFLNAIRKNFPPQGQRIVDHLSVAVSTNRPDLADSIAPTDDSMKITNSQKDAQRTTDRLMQGLPLQFTPDMVPEDYVQIWIGDMTIILQRIMATGNTATMEDIIGLNNISHHIDMFLQVMSQNEDEREKVRQYADLTAKLMNQVKALAQRLQEQMQSQGQQNGANGEQAAEMAKLKGKMLMDQVKAENSKTSHAQKTAQRQVQFEMEEQRKDRAAAADIQRKNAEADQKLISDQMAAGQAMINQSRQADLDRSLTEQSAQTKTSIEE